LNGAPQGWQLWGSAPPTGRHGWFAFTQAQTCGISCVFVDIENCLRPPELAVKVCDSACEPLVLPDQRQVRRGLSSSTLLRQGLERGRIGLRPPSCKMRRISPFALDHGAELAQHLRLVSLAKDPALVLGPELTPDHPLRHGRIEPTWGALAPASSAAAVVGGTPVGPSRLGTSASGCHRRRAEGANHE
jgi:hypothetical protein